MRKLFKKSLAICVAAVLCLTLFAGALSVNAEASTFSTNAISAEPGDSVTVNFTITNFSEVEGARIRLTMPSVVESIDAVRYNGAALAAYDDDEGTGYYQIIDGTTIKFLSLFGFAGELDATDTLVLNIDVTIDDEAEAGTYNYGTPFIELGNEEELIEVTGAFGAFTVTEPVVEPVCEHEWVFKSVVPATENAEGTITFECSECHEEKVEAVGYHAYNMVLSTSAACESEILMTFSAYSQYFKTGSDANTTMMVITQDYHDHNDGNTLKATPVAYDVTDDNYTANGTIQSWTVGVKAISMSENINIVVLAKSGDKWYNGMVTNTSYATYAKTMIPTATPEIKTVLVDAINYGASSQLATNHFTTSLANEQFDEYQQYASDTSLIPEATNTSVLSNTGAELYIVGYSLLAESKTTIRFRLYPVSYKGDGSDINVNIAYTDYKGNPKNLNFTTESKDMFFEGGSWYLDFAELCSAEMRTAIQVTVTAGNGQASVSDLSIESLIAQMRTSATELQKACHNSMLRYGDSAIVAFAK